MSSEQETFMLIAEGEGQMPRVVATSSNGDISELLIEIVRAKPFLYNTRDPLYKNLLAKQNAWQEIAGIFELTASEVQKKWNSLRDTFNRNHKKVTHSTSGQGAKTTGPWWPYYSQMLWYKDFTQLQRPTLTNYHSSSSDGDSSSPPFFVPQRVSTTIPNPLPGFPEEVRYPSPPTPQTPTPGANPTSSPASSSETVSSNSIPATGIPQNLTPTLPRPSGRLVPPPDNKKRRRQEYPETLSAADQAVLDGMVVMTDAVRALSSSGRSAQPVCTEDSMLEAFKTMVALEFAEVPHDRRADCRLAVMQTIHQYK